MTISSELGQLKHHLDTCIGCVLRAMLVLNIPPYGIKYQGPCSFCIEQNMIVTEYDSLSIDQSYIYIYTYTAIYNSLHLVYIYCIWLYI